jgi:hypothetical protein
MTDAKHLVAANAGTVARHTSPGEAVALQQLYTLKEHAFISSPSTIKFYKLIASPAHVNYIMRANHNFARRSSIT